MLVWLLVGAIFGTGLSVFADTKSDLRCGACRVTVLEIHKKINEAELENKMIDSGSFRIDSKGNNAVKKVPYARSDTHLTHIVESVCQNLFDYAEASSENDASRRGYLALTNEDGKKLNSSGLDTGAHVQEDLRRGCESMIDDHEEELVTLFKKTGQSKTAEVQEACVGITNLCNQDQLALTFSAPLANEEPEPAVEPTNEEHDKDEKSGDDESEKSDSSGEEKTENDDKPSTKEEL